MFQVWRWGRWIKWSIAASDSGVGKANTVSGGPQRKTTDEKESSKYASGWTPKARD